MARNPLQKKSGPERPEIWASGGQRPPLDLRALGRASVRLSREGVAPIHSWAARKLRRVAVDVKDGRKRIPVERLGRVERFVPSHLRVAGWIKALAATLSHASANADPDVARGNALVAKIAPHLWGAAADAVPAPPADPAPPGDVPPVVLSEPQILHPGDDPLASIRDEFAAGPDRAETKRPESPDTPPPPPGPLAEGAIQVAGYLIGWGSVILALPYGATRALWLWGNGRDLMAIGREE